MGLILCGCGPPTRRSASIQKAKAIEASAGELVARNRSLLAVYSAQIEGGADAIMQGSQSAPVQRQALLWKAEAIPAMQAALFNPDPVAATVDAWAYLYQMRAYLKRPEIGAGFGRFQTVAATTVNTMDLEMEHLVLLAAPGANVADLRQRIRRWADAHPLQGGWDGRASVDAEFVKATGQGDLGALASLQALQEGLGDVTARLDAYNAYLPKQARWQAELLARDLASEPQFSNASASLAAATKALDQTSAMMEQLPALTEKAHATVRSDVDAQRLAAQAFVRGERLDTQDFLEQQRVAAAAELRAERLAATADLRSERSVVLAAVRQDEAVALSELRTISQVTVRDFDARARGLIDYFFWRALELLLVALALCWLGLWLLLRRRAIPRQLRGRDERDRAA